MIFGAYKFLKWLTFSLLTTTWTAAILCLSGLWNLPFLRIFLVLIWQYTDIGRVLVSSGLNWALDVDWNLRGRKYFPVYEWVHLFISGCLNSARPTLSIFFNNELQAFLLLFLRLHNWIQKREFGLSFLIVEVSTVDVIERLSNIWDTSLDFVFQCLDIDCADEWVALGKKVLLSRQPLLFFLYLVSSMF